jgi:hypothetical protein
MKMFYLLKSHIDRILDTPRNKFKEFDILYHDPNDIASKTYNTNPNPENQILIFIQYLCKKGNTKMQDFMRSQPENDLSFDLV